MTTALLAQRLRAFIDESCRESAHRVTPTADFHKTFLAENRGWSRQAVRASMQELGFERTWIRMYRYGKSRVTAVYAGLELTCEVPTDAETESLQSDDISLHEHADAEPELRVITPTIEFYTREMMPTIVANWRRQYADTLMEVCKKFRERAAETDS